MHMHVYIRLLVAVYKSKALSGLGQQFHGVLTNRIVTPQIGLNPGPRYDAILTYISEALPLSHFVMVKILTRVSPL